MNKKITDKEAVRAAVREGYGQIAKKGGTCSSGVSCCGSSTEDSAQLAQYVGYSAEELAALPDRANMGLSCGNPNALAALRPGEVVLDLGSGGGFDVFIAGRKVGATGQAIGVDMTPEMLAKARKKYHCQQAQQLGVSKADMARAVQTGARVKESPHQAILRLADKLTGASLGQPVDSSDRCCGPKAEKPAVAGRCCG